MKRIGALVLLCCVLVCGICGCSNSKTTETVLDYVDLCDYKAIEVPKEEYMVSDTDLSTAIQMHMNSLNIEASELSDSIAVKYFNCENASAVKDVIKKEIIENRFYEAARDMILESSVITGFPEDSNTYVNSMVSAQKTFAEAEGVCLSEYLNSYYEMTEEEFREAALCGYGDIMILKAVAEKEKYTIDVEERNSLIESILSDRYGDCLCTYSFNAPMQKIAQHAEHRPVVADFDFSQLQRKGDALCSIPNLSSSPFFYRGYRKELDM